MISSFSVFLRTDRHTDTHVDICR